MRAALDTSLATASDHKTVRAETVRILSEARKAGRQCIANAFADDPIPGRRGTRAYSWLTDQIVCEVLHVAQTYMPVSYTHLTLPTILLV